MVYYHINKLGRVGKTSIINKYVKNKFEEGSESTLNSYYLEKDVEYENQKFTLCIWVINRIIQGYCGTRKIQCFDTDLLSRCESCYISLRCYNR